MVGSAGGMGASAQAKQPVDRYRARRYRQNLSKTLIIAATGCRNVGT